MFPVQTIMSTDVKTISPDTPIYVALNLIEKHRISGLPVVDPFKRVVGILTEKDLLRVLLEKNVDVFAKVEDYMSREVICFTEEDSAVDICKFFLRTNIRRVPITRDGVLVGIISRRDIVGLIIEAKSKMSDLRYV